MALLNIDLPRHLYGFIRAEFVYDLQEHHGELLPCVIFAAASQRNRSLTFHVLLEDGAQFARIPLHALCYLKDAPRMTLPDLMLWDCFGEDVTVAAFAYLREMEATAFLRSGEQRGTYVCSFDWVGNGYSETPEQHKVMHLLALQNGCFALQPNNRLRWEDPSFTRPFVRWPRYRTNTRYFCAETSLGEIKDPEAYFYGVR